MPNYSASDSSMSKSGGSLVGGSKVGGSAVGGALNVLSQYDANSEGDEYSAQNPNDEYLNMLKEEHTKGGSLFQKLQNASNMVNSEVAKHILKLNLPQHHLLVQNAKHLLSQGAPHGGALSDIAKSTSPSHLASMVINDHHMKKEEGASLVGGNFLDDLGKTASSLAPLLPLML